MFSTSTRCCSNKLLYSFPGGAVPPSSRRQDGQHIPGEHGHGVLAAHVNFSPAAIAVVAIAAARIFPEQKILPARAVAAARQALR